MAISRYNVLLPPPPYGGTPLVNAGGKTLPLPLQRMWGAESLRIFVYIDSFATKIPLFPIAFCALFLYNENKL